MIVLRYECLNDLPIRGKGPGEGGGRRVGGGVLNRVIMYKIPLAKF